MSRIRVRLGVSPVFIVMEEGRVSTVQVVVWAGLG